jgi:hypothetical protein
MGMVLGIAVDKQKAPGITGMNVTSLFRQPFVYCVTRDSSQIFD